MTVSSRIRRAVLGAPKDVRDPNAFHKLSLVALLAWVGLGADGLSSSAYGPEEAFRALGQHTGLAVFLAAATAFTVFVISYGYSRIIEQFPSGGGGYVVASKILGPRVGVVAGTALLVDYVLTITISIASGADAIFSFLPHAWHPLKLPATFGGLALLTLLNLRGVKESVTAIAPIFVAFVLTHVVLLAVAIGGHAADLPRATAEVSAGIGRTTAALGGFGALVLFLRAYSLGGGTYTGIEAVSNSVSIMREPRVVTAKRTMAMLAFSLAITAAGILLAYLLVHVAPSPGKTMNAVLVERVAGTWSLGGLRIGPTFIVLTLLSEAGLLFIGAQAGFTGGPRVMANMATDSWLPHRFSALSERLTMKNGVLLLGFAAAVALLYTGGSVSRLVVMYSINVFVTFLLSNVAMSVYWVRHRKDERAWWRHLPTHLVAVVLCLTILVVTILVKFTEGAWLTLLVTGALTVFCFVVRRHYGLVVRALRRLDKELPGPEAGPEARRLYGETPPGVDQAEPDPKNPVAVLFVGGYGGLGRHALLTLLRMFPGHFKGVVFVSIAVVDSDTFKGVREVESLERRTQEQLDRYVRFARTLGLPARRDYAVGTEVAVEAEDLGRRLLDRYPRALVVAGQLIFEEDTAWTRALHNETAFLIQRRLQHAGVPMIVLPVRLNLRATRRNLPVVPRASITAPPPATGAAADPK